MNSMLTFLHRAGLGAPGLLPVATFLLTANAPGLEAASVDPAGVPLLTRSFVEGREYFVLRSGRAKLIAQADQADLAPAFLYLLFDAQDNRQSARKERAFNFGDGHGFLRSALEVMLGGFAFTALGHQTQTRWVLADGVPAAEATWWAGGLRVTERLLALGSNGLFLRRVQVASVNLGGPETVWLRLHLPPGACAVRDGWLAQDLPGCRLALGAAGPWPIHAVPARGLFEVGPLALAPGQSVSVDTLLWAQIPAADAAADLGSPLSVEAPVPSPAAASPARSPIWVEPVGAPRTELNWARPARPCDAAFANILVSYRDPLHFRVHLPAGETVALAFGLCEGYHKEPGQRVLQVQVEGRSPSPVDPVAAAGANVPMVFGVEARDEDRNGRIEVAVATAERSKDRNPILNALWVFAGAAPPAESVMDGSSNTKAAAFIHALQPETSPPGQPLPALRLGAILEQTRAGWAVASAVVTEDATVRDIFDKARFGLPGMVADNGVMDAGIFEYGAQWVRDTSNTLLGMVHAGHFELARRGFAHVLEHMVNAEGNAMIAGSFEDPDREQFDQMGELLHALKAYRDWTGDDSLLREHHAKLVALVERPLRPEFRDSTTGLLHNRREFWERTLEDACELAYQTYVILGLRDAAALAEPLGVPERASGWRAEADRLEQAMLRHPTRALVAEGRLIKRRSVTGEWVRTIRFPAAAPDVPLRTERVNLAEPDATLALPIAFRLVDPRSELARKTLDELEKLWNARWFGGGYERYHSSGQCDQPGPWTFASCFILRAQHEAGLFERSRRTLEWLNTVQGGRTGSWFEEIPLVRSQAPTAGILPWTSGEIGLFVVRHLLGVRFEDRRLVLKPALYPGSPPVKADLRFRAGRLRLDISGAGPVLSAECEGRPVEVDRDGAVRLPDDFAGGTIRLRAAP
jgi:hypothetical protein